jgi:hypothetical protein
MSREVFAVALVLSAGALALWLDARAAGLAPRDVRRLAAHAFVAFGLLQLIPSGEFATWFTFVAIFGGALPALVYAALVMLWTVRLVRGATAAR